MNCRENCGACCVGLSISSAIPGLPDGKPAGMRCIHLSNDLKCLIYEQRPKVCQNFKAELDFCGTTREEALDVFYKLENGFIGAK